MSTIISRGARGLALAALVLAIWAAIMVAMPFMGSGRDVAVTGDAANAVRTIRAAGGAVIEVRRGAVIARSAQSNFVGALYAAGAPLVIEGRIAAGCFPPKAGA